MIDNLYALHYINCSTDTQLFGDFMRKNVIIALLALLMLVPALSACNTMEGAGQDVQKGGENLSNAANRNK